MPSELEKLVLEIRSCTECANYLPLGPRPILSVGSGAKILLVGQAPGSKVHASGIPWEDASGDRIRSWMNISRENFYDPDVLALVPMGFCYPGRGRSGDLPPRKECAPLWHEKLLDCLPNLQLVLLVGQYAQKYYLAENARENLTETVRRFEDYTPDYFPLPHPSPRNNIWIKKNPWFEERVLPGLKILVAKAIE